MSMLVQAFLEIAVRYPDKVAVNDPTRSLTYAQLKTFAKAMRRLLMNETSCPRVGVLLPATAAGLGTTLGTLWAGKTIVPLNFLLQKSELAAVVRDARIDLVVSIQHFRELAGQLGVRVIYLEELNLRRRYLLQKLAPTPPAPDVNDDDLAAIVYTSGTTGQPKGVCLSHGNFMSNIRAAIEHLDLQPDNHLLGVLPPFHVFGLTIVTMLPVYLGGTVTYIPRFSPQEAYRAIAEKDITILLAVPSMYAAIARLKTLDKDKFSRIRLAVSGGEPLPRQVYDWVLERTGIRLLEGYGLTETSPVISVDVPESHQPGSVGLPLPGVELQVRDENGHPLPQGQRGELCVRGPLVMKGYFHRQEETSALIDRDGWLSTGDIVELGEENRIWITGRAKDIIIVGGENVYPREVECVLEEHPDVSEAAVIGRSDGNRGEVVTAFVILRDGADATPNDLRGWCRERLASYKVPREIHFREEFPRGPTGKILKRDLRSNTETPDGGLNEPQGTLA